MDEEFNNFEIEELEQNNNRESPSKQNKFVPTRKRRELINTESDNEENLINKKPLQKIPQEESKEEENEEYLKENIKSKYNGNKFNTINQKNISGTTLKDKSALQEKLKKIFMNRDKLKFQYTKQEIPDNLKYHSDDSESSDISGLRKSKISKKNNSIKKNEINSGSLHTNRESKQNSNRHKMSNFSNSSNNNNNKGDLKTSDLDGGSTFSPPRPAAFQAEQKDINLNNENEEKENIFNLNKKQKNEDKRKLSSYNDDEEEEKIKSNEKNNNKFERRSFKYNNNKWNNEEEEEKDQENVKEEEEEENNIIKKESAKKNILLKMFEKREKKNDFIDNEDNDNINENRFKHTNKKESRNDGDTDKNEKKQKLLKLLFEKKESNTIENDDENEEEPAKNIQDIEKENRRRKIIEELKESSNPSTIKKNKLSENLNKNEIFEREEKSNKNEEEYIERTNEEKNNKKEEEYIDKEYEEEIENENDNPNDKGTFLSNRHKNKLTISIKPKNKMSQQIPHSSIDNKYEIDHNNNKSYNEEEEEEKSKKNNNKANALLDLLEKLKKSKEQNITKKESIEEDNNNNYNNKKNIDDDINESEIEKEAERIRKKEKKMEERRMAREKRKNIPKNENKEEENNININNNKNYYDSKRKFYNNNNYNNNYDNKETKINNVIDNRNYDVENENKKEENKRRKKLEEDLKAEINDYNKEDDSTVNNSKSNLINNSLNTQLTQLENEDKNKNKKKELNGKGIPTRNIQGRNNNIIDEGAAPNEIILNDMPRSNLDRSFDAANTYMKRKVLNGRNTLNVYRPRRPDLRGRSQERITNELIENNPNSFNPNLNINYNNLNNQNNGINKLTYIKKKSSFNDKSNFILNNHSFCEYPKENDNQNSIRERNDMDIDLGGLNSSFDAYMRMNINNNNFIGNINDPFYGTASKKFNNNGSYNRDTHAPVNLNYNKNYVNSFYKKGNNTVNNNPNRSYGFINQNNYNNNMNNNNMNNNNINYNNNNNNYNYNNNYNNYNNNYNNNFNNNYNNNDLKTRSNILNKNNQYYGSQNQQFITYNNNSQNPNIYNNSPLRTYENQSNSNIQNDTYNNYFPNSPKRYDSSKIRESLHNTKNDNYMNNNTSFTPQYERNTSINIEDLMVLEEKFNEIILALNKNHIMHNECFEFWNYYYNCSFYGKLEKLFKNENESNNVQISINHILISVMICYDYSFEMDILNNEYSILIDILELNHRNLIIICEHILSKISSESKSNPWVLKLHQLVNNFNKIDNYEYTSINGRKLSPVEKINYNVSVIVQNIRVLLKNYKTKKIEHLTSIFKKINEKTYEEINSYFRNNILRVDNVNGSVLASVLKEDEYFQTEPAPYIKTKNRKKYSLILDLDETLVHFKINNEDDSEGVLQIRPGVIPFLEQVGNYYELIVFTAATQDYGDLLIDAIEENNVYFEHRFYRQHTVIIGNDFVKDLDRIGRPLDKIIIVDNMPQNFRLQKENGINIKAFWGEDVNDNALEELGKILINIAKDGNDVRIGLEKYRDEIVKKVTSNISKSNY